MPRVDQLSAQSPATVTALRALVHADQEFILDRLSATERADVTSGSPTLDIATAVQAAYSGTAREISWHGIVSAKIGTAITNTVSGRSTTGCGATITATASMDALFVDSGSGSTYSGLVLDGANLACKGFRCTGANPYIHGNTISNIASSDVRTASAIYCDISGGGARVVGNRISGVNHPGNGTYTDNNGSARGVHITGSSVSEIGLAVADNIIDNITGEEGDAIHVIAYDGVALPYLSGKVSITGNVITQAARRGIKVQAQDVIVSGNVVSNTLPFTGANRNSEAAIDLLASRRMVATGNVVSGDNYVAGVQALGDSTIRLRGGVIAGNTVRVGNNTSWVDNLGNSKPAQCGIRAQYVDALSIVGNAVEGGQSSQIKVINCTGVTCGLNTLVATSASTVGVLVTSSTNCVVSDNIATLDGASGDYNSVVALDAANTNTVRGNKLNASAVSGAYAVNFLNSATGNLVSDNQNNSSTNAPLGGTNTGNTCVNNRNLNGSPSGTPDTAKPYQVPSLGVANWAAATTLGTVNGRVGVYDQFGALKGYLPTYGSIT